MHLSANSLTTNILVTVLVLLFVSILPIIDKSFCKKHNINPTHKRTGWSHEVKILRIRESFIALIFVFYLAAYVYLVFFSRAVGENYKVHVEPLKDFINAIALEGGLPSIVETMRNEGFFAGLSRIKIEKPEDIAQIYMNIMLFVPLGYLLPYVFDFIQHKVTYRPVLFCFLISIITENIQLIFKLGFYDIDDIISNTIGGFIGQWFYISLAYIVERPDWRTAAAETKAWKASAKNSALYHTYKYVDNIRPTIIISDITTINDFYCKKLGMMLYSQHEVDGGMAHLMKLGKNTFEIICYYNSTSVEKQFLTLAVKNIYRIKKQLNKCGFEIGKYSIDEYTGFRKIAITGPEDITITFTEANRFN